MLILTPLHIFLLEIYEEKKYNSEITIQSSDYYILLLKNMN